jgi:hypothetical protein
MDHVSRDWDNDIGDSTASSGRLKTFTWENHFEDSISLSQTHWFGPSVHKLCKIFDGHIFKANLRYGLCIP